MAKPKFKLAAASALIHAINVGFCSTYSSTATEDMKNSFLKPDDFEVSWIGSTLPLGAIVGGVIAGYLADKIGRKGVMIYLSIPLLLGWLLIAYATSLEFVYAGRFITGVCCGLICVVTPMYVVEIATPKVRGGVGFRFQGFICIGIVLVSSIATVLRWNWMAVIGACLAILAPFSMVFIPESPSWLLKKEKHAEAVAAMRFLYGNNYENVGAFIYETYKESQKENSFDIRQPTVYKPALLSVGLMFFQQFSGSNAILYYSLAIIKEASMSTDPKVINILVALIMLSFTEITGFFVDKMGRRISLIISGALTCLSLVILCIYQIVCYSSPLKETYQWIPILCIFMYIATFSIGLGPIPWLMVSEMAPMNARSLICGIGTASSWIFVFIITKTFLELEHLIPYSGAFWLYSFFCLLCCFFTICLPETKGKSFEEIATFFIKSEPPVQRLEEESIDDHNSINI